LRAGAPPEEERFTGCLLGGAVGDALGAPVEFLSLQQIHQRFGPQGLRTYAPAYGRLGAITDDTQMSLFSAEGVIRFRVAESRGESADFERVMHRAYERWLVTQLGRSVAVPWDPDAGPTDSSGWLIHQQFLHHSRAPGSTCISALGDADRIGLPDEPINESKGCGGVMRSGPVGLASGDAFELACRAAALTHGHPSGWLAAGALAEIVANLVRGEPLPAAVEKCRQRLVDRPRSDEVVGHLDRALELARHSGPPRAEDVEELGGGWVAEEALAIAVYCSLTAEDFESGVLGAVNHGGDSDSTGSIAGCLLGTLLGRGAIPSVLLEDLEGREVIEQVGRDLYRAFARGGEVDPDRYPPG
jgi:ADP-ribosylglycohydrolase